MLKRLSVTNFVIVDQLELDFQIGFTALTGETGAGKSILLDAIEAASGGRVDASIVRAGAAKAEVTAAFELLPDSPAARWLAEREYLDPQTPEHPEALLRRVIAGPLDGGRSRAFINGRNATALELRELSSLLINVHGQHENQRLMGRDAQRQWLDTFARAPELVASVADTALAWKVADQALTLARSRVGDAERERDEIEFHLRELRELDFHPERHAEDESEHRRLAHASDLIAAASRAHEALTDSRGTLDSLADAERALTEVDMHDPALSAIRQLLSQASAELDEASRDLRRYKDKVETDSERLAELEKRMTQVASAARKYRTEPKLLATVRERYEARLATLPTAENLARQELALANLATAWAGQARQLTRERQKAAKQVSKIVTASVQRLAMAQAQFEVSLLPLPSGAAPAAQGAETIEFRFAANAGQSLSSLAKVASGGELSRVGLALSVAAGKVIDTPTLVFDEVDAGIGGAVAEIVGQLLRELGSNAQVFVVTHLAQVAAYAHQQWQVQKQERKAEKKAGKTTAQSTVTQVSVLPATARIEELARMIGGVTITEATRQAARELIGAAGG